MPDTTPRHRAMAMIVNVADPDAAIPTEIARQCHLAPGCTLVDADWLADWIADRTTTDDGTRDEIVDWARREIRALTAAARTENASGVALALSGRSCLEMASHLRHLAEYASAEPPSHPNQPVADRIADTVVARLTGTIPGQTSLDDVFADDDVVDATVTFQIEFEATDHPEIDAMHAISQAMATLPGGDDARRRVAVWAADRYGADA